MIGQFGAALWEIAAAAFLVLVILGVRKEASSHDQQHLGLVVATGNDEGQQVLGTCSPELTVTLSALLSRMQRIHDDSVQSVEKYRVELCMDEVRAVLRGER